MREDGFLLQMCCKEMCFVRRRKNTFVVLTNQRPSAVHDFFLLRFEYGSISFQNTIAAAP